jgi:hypothetical protein
MWEEKYQEEKKRIMMFKTGLAVIVLLSAVIG